MIRKLSEVIYTTLVSIISHCASALFSRIHSPSFVSCSLPQVHLNVDNGLLPYLKPNQEIYQHSFYKKSTQETSREISAFYLFFYLESRASNVMEALGLSVEEIRQSRSHFQGQGLKSGFSASMPPQHTSSNWQQVQK